MTNPINPVGYCELHSTNPDRARTFYSELFAWKAEEHPTPVGPYTMFEGILAGLLASRDDGPTGWVPYVPVEDVARSTARAKHLGATVLRDCVEIPDGTFSIIRDPAGAAIGLWQRKG